MNFITINRLTTGEVVVVKNTQYNNINADKVTINTGVTARLYGKVNDLILKKDSKLVMHGSISGKIINEGGELKLFDQN